MKETETQELSRREARALLPFIDAAYDEGLAEDRHPDPLALRSAVAKIQRKYLAILEEVPVMSAWKLSRRGDCWYVPEDDDDRGELERDREFPVFIYEVDIDDEADTAYTGEPLGYVYTVTLVGDKFEDLDGSTPARQCETLEEAQRQAPLLLAHFRSGPHLADWQHGRSERTEGS